MAKVLRRISSKKIARGLTKKASGSHNEALLFEIPLIDDTNHHRCVNFLTSCIGWLRENNANKYRDIFKADINQKNLTELIKLVEKQAILNHYEIPKEEDVNIVANLLRQFFLQMKEPVITFNVYSSFIAANSHHDVKKKVKYLRSALSLLPKNNLGILKILCGFLGEIASAHEVTRTSLEDIAVVFGTALLRPKAETRLLMVTDAEHIAGVVSQLIEDHNEIFKEGDDVNVVKSTTAFQTKMQRLYTSNALASLQELSKLKESENIDNNTFRSTLESLGDQLQKGDSKALQMLVSKNNNNSNEEKGQHVALKRRSSRKIDRSRLGGNTSGALRIQIAKLQIAQQDPAKEPKLSRAGPEDFMRSDTEGNIADEMSSIMKQIYGEDADIKETKVDYKDEEKEELRKILTNMYFS